MTHESSTPSAAKWVPLELRMIAFPEPLERIQEHEWWHEIAGSPDDFECVRRRLIRTDTGTFQGHTLRLDVEPIKITWGVKPQLNIEINPSQNLESLVAEIPTLGEFESAFKWFCGHMQRWLLEFSPPLNRLAFIAKIFMPTENRDAAYVLLNKFLHKVEVDPKSTEFLYKINRKRDSRCGIENLRINRLTTWSAALLEMTIASTEEGNPQPVKKFNVLGQHGVHLLLDINSDADFNGVLPVQFILPLLDELVQMAIEIANCGDIE